MKTALAAASSVALAWAVAAVSPAAGDCPPPQTVGSEGLCLPALELRGDLGTIFTVSDCQWISGLTCHIAYNGARPLPSEVFFTEYDAAGKPLGPRTRLIHPHLGTASAASPRFELGRRRPRGSRSRVSGKGPGRIPTERELPRALS